MQKSRSEQRLQRIQKRKRRLLCILITATVVVLVGGLCGWLYINSLVYDTCRVEAGVTVTASDFLKVPNEEAYFTENSKPFDVTLPGEYQVIIKNGWLTHHCTLIVEDTIAPEGEPVSVTLEYGQTCEAADFVTNVTDATQVAISYVEEPDFSLDGVQAVQILLRDLGGNETVLQSELSMIHVLTEVTVEAGGEAPDLEAFVLVGDEVTLLTDLNEIDYTQPGEYEILLEVDGLTCVAMLRVVDTTPPIIQGTTDITVCAGDSISYKKSVSVIDNCSAGATLSVDSSQVHLDTAGTYPVTYTATDSSGNVSSTTISVTVIDSIYTVEQIYAMADEVLDEIITEDMTTKEKARAIYDYAVDHLSYVATSEKADWLEGAYEGFTRGRGDCYTYFALCKALLNRAEIPNIDMSRVGGKFPHYWQLINVGDGWYHFDASPHNKKFPLDSFMLTEAEARAYTEWIGDVNPNYYVYDYDACPVTVEGTPE